MSDEPTVMPDTDPQEAATGGPPPGSADLDQPAQDGLTTDAVGISVEDPAAEVAPEATTISVEDLVADLERVSAERDQYLDSLRRMQAEFENYRKAVAKRESDARERANEGLVGEMLPVLDACDAAINHGAQDVDPIRTTLVEALVKQGLERMEPQGEPFDPQRHEAVMHEPSDEPGDPVVAEVLRVGYGWRGRTLRPAMVRVRG